MVMLVADNSGSVGSSSNSGGVGSSNCSGDSIDLIYWCDVMY